jgi:hypothetical protein
VLSCVFVLPNLSFFSFSFVSLMSQSVTACPAHT